MHDIPDLQEVLQQPVQLQPLGEAQISQMHIPTMQYFVY